MTALVKALATGAIVAGVVVGLIPLGDCGSVFRPGDSWVGADGCDELRGQTTIWPVMLIVLGVAAHIGAFIDRQGSEVMPSARTPEREL